MTGLSPEAWAFLTAMVGGLVAIVTTQIVQGQTTRRALLEAKQEQVAKTETVGRQVARSAEAAELAVQNTAAVSNGTVPRILRHLEDQGGMLVRIATQVDQLSAASGRTVARLDQTTGQLMDHLADHARTGEINLRGATNT